MERGNVELKDEKKRNIGNTAKPYENQEMKDHGHRTYQRLYRLRNLRLHLSHGCHPPGHEDEKGVYQISGGLPALPPVPDVLSGGRHHHFSGKINSGNCLMGMKMKTQIQTCFISQSLLVFAGIPLLFWALGDLPLRSFLKEFLSVITILGCCQMIGLFFWSRSNRVAVKELRMSRVMKFHEIIGYTCVTILFFHPFFLVIPRFFEGGIAPLDAFATIVTTLNRGVILGIIAWILMATMGVTALLRKKLPMRYTAWRNFTASRLFYW